MSQDAKIVQEMRSEFPTEQEKPDHFYDSFDDPDDDGYAHNLSKNTRFGRFMRKHGVGKRHIADPDHD